MVSIRSQQKTDHNLKKNYNNNKNLANIKRSENPLKPKELCAAFGQKAKIY